MKNSNFFGQLGRKSQRRCHYSQYDSRLIKDWLFDGRNIELLRKQEKNSRKPSEDLTKYSQKALPCFAENKQKRFRYPKSGPSVDRFWGSLDGVAECASVSEESLCEHGEVDTPVAPDVAAFAFVVFVGVLHLVEVASQGDVLLEEEVVLADGYPVEVWLGGEEGFQLSCCFGVVVELLFEALL